MALKQKTGVDSRKRTLPSSADLTVPPNKKIPKPTAKDQLMRHQKEKELLYQRSALESRSPFYLRMPFPLPVIQQSNSVDASIAPTPKPYTSLGSPAFYPYLPTPSTPSTSSVSSGKSYSVSDLIGEKTSTLKSQTSSTFGSPNSVGGNGKRTQPPATPGMSAYSPWSPFQSGLITGLPTPPSNESIVNKEFTSTNEVRFHNPASVPAADESTKKNESNPLSVPPASSSTQYSATTRVPNVGSPFFYMYNSPVSPMVLLRSPNCGPSSVQSVPSVSSSSGCSSMSEGSILSVPEKMNPPSNSLPPPRIAPTEYHVGVKVPNPPTSDESCTSDGIATPTPGDSDDEDEVDVEKVEPCYTSRTSDDNSPSFITNPIAGSTTPPTGSTVCSSLSVQSLVGNKSAHQTELTNLNPALQHHMQQQRLFLLEQQTAAGALNHSNLSSPSSSRESSPEPDFEEDMPTNTPSVHKMAAMNVQSVDNGEDVFALVPGRLSLLSATQKYKITVDEVRRRLSNPECLNASVLGGILRRAKSKNGGHHLRQNLEEKGLSLPPGRRKQTEITLFTSLVEGEALHLANDHRRICQNFFPHQELAQLIGHQHAGSPQSQERLRMVEGARVLLSEFQAMVDAVDRPSNISPSDPNNHYPGLTNFNLISHGFGNPSISTAVSVIQNYLQELSRMYKDGSSNPPGAASAVTPEGSFSSNRLTMLPGSNPVVMGNSSGSHGNSCPGYLSQLPINLLKQEPKEV